MCYELQSVFMNPLFPGYESVYTNYLSASLENQLQRQPTLADLPLIFTFEYEHSVPLHMVYNDVYSLLIAFLGWGKLETRQAY